VVGRWRTLDTPGHNVAAGITKSTLVRDALKMADSLANRAPAWYAVTAAACTGVARRIQA